MKTIKALLFPLLVLSSLTGHSKNYYISSSGNNSNSGLNPASAWQTITKLNSSFGSIAAGDSVLFKRGEIFYGTIVVNKSGSVANRIVIGAYGNGMNPIVTGLTTISSWVSLGGNIWEATVSGGLSSLNTVIFSGADTLTPMGRTPNVDSANRGYRMFESTSGNNTITDNQLGVALGNWTGAELVARSQDFITVRTKITSHSGSTLHFSTVSGQSFKPGMGYFIQNDARTLDQNGEWYYDTSKGTKKIRVYYNITPPVVRVATLTNLIYAVGNNGSGVISNVSFLGIDFIGSEGNIVQATYCNNMSFSNCTFKFAGIDGIDSRYTPNLSISNSTFSNINNIGWWTYVSGLTTGENFSYNTVHRVGWHPGMLAITGSIYGETAPGSGISTSNSYRTISNNKFDSIGYSGMNIGHGDNVLVRNNIVKYFCQIKNDGGGIYSPAFRLGTDPRAYNYLVDGNIVSNSLDASLGTDHINNQHARGLYFDAATTGRTVTNNTVYSCWEGIYISSPQHVRITGNLVFDCGFYRASPLNYSGALSISNANPVPQFQYVRNDTITNNVFAAKYTDQLLFYDYDLFDSCRNIGRLDSNYYINSGSNSKLFTHNPTWPNIYYDLSAWKRRHLTYDQNSLISPVSTPLITATNFSRYMRFEVNETNLPKTINIGSFNWIGAKGNSYPDIITLQPFTAVVLFKGNENVPPVSNAGVNQTIVLPANTATLTGSGYDSDGTITGYAWNKVSGPSGGSISLSNSISTGITGLAIGVYQYELTVTDNNGGKGRDTVQVTVSVPVNLGPSANAGDNKIVTLPANTTTLTGTGSDGDGTIIGFTWVKISGPSGGVISTPHTANTAVNNLILGVYCYELTVTDNEGATGKDTITIQVTANLIVKANKPPVANAGSDQVINLPINFTTLSGSGIDPDGSISSYAWSKLSGPATGAIANPEYATATVNNLLKGVYQFCLTITDEEGAIAKDTVQVYVNAAAIVNQKPNASAGNDINIVLPVNTVLLKGAAADSDGNIAAYKWKVVSGPSGYKFETPNSTETKLNNLFQGVYEVEFEVTDNAGGKATDTLNLTVMGQRVSAVISNEIKIYPNPVRDVANLNITAVNKISKIRISVTDMKGALIKSNEMVTSDNITRYQLNMSNLNNSNYIVTVRFDDGQILSAMVLKHNGQ